MPKPRGYSSKANEEKIKAAVKSGKISKKQMDGLSEPLLLGIIKKGDSKGGIKEKREKIGAEKGKAGRPKAGSKVKIVV
tara:strand:- start:519 stop:755 length:237 start_codon:yes stop_codon:yes gene_type:complete